ncbi:MAG: ATP synthase F1 subunit delta [Bacteroidales bacterium]|jgi:F-type H+-transporting ATPase subunit delta|nr:ATP synthase F1 subunit delta [Bacteroidales bacterium]
MGTVILQTRYAKALFVLAQQMNRNEEVYLDMLRIEKVCNENHILRAILKNPTIKPLKKKAILKELFSQSVSQLTMEFLSLLLTKRRDMYLLEIASQYIKLYKEDKGIKTVNVTTAAEMSSKIAAELEDILRKELNTKIEMHIKQNTSLIGGIKIEVDDKLYDASLLKSFSVLRQSFAQNIYESGF